ncbi:hypothetical protein [Xanthobacter sediminis]
MMTKMDDPIPRARKNGRQSFPGAVADMIAKNDETSIYTSLVSSQLDATRDTRLRCDIPT